MLASKDQKGTQNVPKMLHIKFNWCQLLCLHFSGMCESSTHLCHRPQKTAIACPLVTNGKQTNACWETLTQPKESCGSIVTVKKKNKLLE